LLIVLAAVVVAACTVPRDDASDAAAPAATKPAATKPATTRAATDADRARAAAMEPLYPPPSPVPLLSPEQEAATFKLPKGLKVEVVAAEPMVEHPVAMSFDGDGRIWVAQMRSYMPNVDGVGENTPDGRVSILEDTDGDGRMDKSTVFLDGLVLPRAVQCVGDGALIGAPPNLWFVRDKNKDGKADDKVLIATDYGDRVNPEHQPNGLVYGIDNWFHNADYNKRFKLDRGRWISDIVPSPGQYGITQDDVGRHFFNSNSDYLRGNYIAPQYATRNPHHSAAGVNVQVAADQECWPAHQTAINRGYRAGFLRDGRLRAFTGACSPCIYRGDLLPREYYGNAFVCEVTANLIRRAVLTETDAIVHGRNAHERDEFLTSTYERFRPVNIYTGLEGALYIVDMHHGIIQHKRFVTPYSAAQYKARELTKHLRTGRIFRIVPDNVKVPPTPRLSKAKSADLVASLSSPNGAVRDLAQRLLVERNPSSATTPLKLLITSGENPLARMHGLWTLDGMYRLDMPTLRLALRDTDPRVRAQALRIAEPILGARQRDEILEDVLKLESDAQPNVRLQYVLTVSAVGIPRTDASIARVLSSDAHNLYVRDGAISGLRARELEFIESLLADPQWAGNQPGRPELLWTLAQCVMMESKRARVARLMELATSNRLLWQQKALVGGMSEIARVKFARRPLMLESAPPANLIALSVDSSLADRYRERPGGSTQSSNGNDIDRELRKHARFLMKNVAWPGKPGYVPPPPPRPMNSTEQARFDEGAKVYALVCTQCHKPDGQGQEGLAPPLVNSDWVLGPEQRLARIVLHGMRGPITVNGKTYNLDMPSWGALTDEQIAAVMTYSRRSWEHEADPVDPQIIAKIRNENASRLEAWTERELLRIK
jgi:mono/diheme cytochrome c family protein/glucose/arabinose dehydrogenase